MDDLIVLKNAFDAGFFHTCNTQDDIHTRLENLFGRKLEHFHSPGFFGSTYQLGEHLVQVYMAIGRPLFWRFLRIPPDPNDYKGGVSILGNFLNPNVGDL